MQWQDWCRELVEVLGLWRTPVGVVYTDVLPQGVETPNCRACSALHRAAAGETIGVSAASSACPGGAMYLGFRTPAPEQMRKLRDFLINGEKLFSCPAAIHRAQKQAVQPPLGMAEYAVLGPLDTLPLQPDVVVVICNPAQAARLIGLSYYESGEPLQCDPTGALCRAAITYSLVTNRVNVTFGDITARKMEHVPEDQLYVTLPLQALRSVIASLDGCSCGRAAVDMSKLPTAE